MRGHDGLWVLERLAQRGLLGRRTTRVLMLTTFDLDEYTDEALTLGAAGFLLMSCSYEEPLAALRATASGDGALSTSVRPAGHRRLRRPPPGRAPGSRRLGQAPRPPPRDRDVLQLIGEGLGNAELAARLVLSEHTVKAHLSRVLTKTGCRSRGQTAPLSRRVTGP